MFIHSSTSILPQKNSESYSFLMRLLEGTKVLL
jgi:hypothetical protein